MSIDLHIHSIFSDGTHTPAEIVLLAKKRGLSAISITDHDTISGIEESVSAAKEFGIEAIPGIELSVVHEHCHLHILGYLFNYKNDDLIQKISVIQDARVKRNEKIIAKLRLLGIDIGLREVNTISKVGQTGRPHIAQVLCKKGVAKNFNEAFKKYLCQGAKAYFPRFVYSAEEAINIIKENGGLAVLAHPAQIDPSLQKTSKVVPELAELGLDGLEVYYPTHSANVRKKLKKIAEKHNMIITGGSDYHGTIRPGTDIAGGKNKFVPPELLDKMKQKWRVGK